MTKKEVIEEIRKINGYVEEAMSDLESLKQNLNSAYSHIENIPDEADEIDDGEEKE